MRWAGYRAKGPGNIRKVSIEVSVSDQGMVISDQSRKNMLRKV